MRKLFVLITFFLAGSLVSAQKTNTDIKKGNQDDGTTHITPGSSGVKRSIGYKFSNELADTDPGNGVFRYNNDNPSSITYIYLDKIDVSGEDQTKWYSTWDDPTGATGRGQLFIVDDRGQNKSVLNVSGVFVKEDGYWKIPVEFVSGGLPVDGVVYYYVFNRIAKKEKENKSEQVTVVNQDTVGKNEKPVIVATGVVLAAEANNVTQVTQVNQEKKEIQENQVTQEKKEVQENQVTQEKKEVQENQATQEKKEVQENQATQVTKQKKELQGEELQQNQNIKETDIVTGSVIVAASQTNTTKPVVQSNKTTQSNQQTTVNQTAQNKPVTQTTTINQVTQDNNKTQANQQTTVNQATQNNPVTQTNTINQGVQNNTINQVSQQSKVNQTPQNKPVNQPLTANQGMTNTTVQQNQQTKVNQTTQNKPVTQTSTVTQGTQNSNTNQVKQEIKVTSGTQTATSGQTTGVSQNNQYSYNQANTSTQSTKHRKCYRGIIEIGYDLGLGSYGINNFKFNFINGFKIGPYASVGLGIGYRHYYYKNENHTDKFLVSEVNQIPVFLDLRTSFSGRKITPYLAVGIGGSTGSRQEGLYFTTSGGIWFNLSERFAVFAGLAYDLQKLEFSDTNPFTNNYNKYSNSLGLNLGISF